MTSPAMTRVRLCAAVSALPLVLFTGATPAVAHPALPSTATPTAPRVVVGTPSAAGQTSTALCPAGTRVVGGGHYSTSFHYSDRGDIHDAVLANAPTRAGGGWVVRQLKGRSQALALCVPAKEAPRVAVGAARAAGRASKATCPTGTRVTGGGFLSNTFHRAAGGTIHDFVRTSSPDRSGGAWLAAQVRGKVRAVALCAPTRTAPRVVVGAAGAAGRTSKATCPTGTRVTGGGHYARTFPHDSSGPIHDAVSANTPSPAGDGWVARQLTGEARAVALCAPDGQAPTVAVGAAGAAGRASKATCPTGTRVAGGGHYSHSFPHRGGGPIHDYVRTSSPSGSGDGWIVRQLKGEVRALALCVRK
ncbi:hypothetical protein [Streptomyces sp. HSG2]|uniref:hypothetical protein n=1 Tax=Streptomyces sp. HSG2 TaxID=2797167 RepID=UPI001906D03A|nr:hypothetical protein [Streptomyces sp. HSG2]